MPTRHFVYLFVFFAALLSACTSASIKCNDPQNTSETRECASLELKKSIDRLGHLEKKITELLTSYGGEETSKDFLGIQKKWHSFVEMQCVHKRSLYGRGSFAGTSYIVCMTIYTNQRIESIKKTYSHVLTN